MEGLHVILNVAPSANNKKRDDISSTMAFPHPSQWFSALSADLLVSPRILRSGVCGQAFSVPLLWIQFIVQKEEADAVQKGSFRQTVYQW